MHPADPLDPHALIGPGLLAGFEWLAEAASTMDRAREFAADPAAKLPAGVVADRQAAGRGRRGARWWQPPGSLAVSLVVAVADGSAQPPPTWSLACGVALAESLVALEPALVPRVRWPNDVEASGGKLAGIIVETAPGPRLVVGVGVNSSGTARAAPRGIGRAIATVPDLVGHDLPREPLIAAFVTRLVRLLGEMTADDAVLVERYRPLCALTGRDVTVFRERGAGGGDRISGPCLGIDRHGALVIDTVAGPIHLATGSLSDPAGAWRGESPA